MFANNSSSIRNQTTGDRAAHGLLRGVAAGLVMAVVLVLVGLALGDTLDQAISRFSPSGIEVPLQGVLVHLGVSAVYGTVFGLLQPLLPRRLPGWLTGLVYGLLLYGLALAVVLPRTGPGMANLPPLALALAHGIYGLVLGL